MRLSSDVESGSSGSLELQHSWTFTHGFYAAMGGFVLDTSPRPIVGDQTRFVLTPTGVQFLMVHAPDLLPDISEASIWDRSKADSLAKALLVWQVFYFCATCLSRHFQGLPLTLLEVSTLAHATCTILTYIVWWKKPLNVLDPTLIQGQRAQELAALMLMMSPSTRVMLAGVFRIPCPREYDFIQPVAEASRTSGTGAQQLNAVTLKPTEALPGTRFAVTTKSAGTWSAYAFGRQSLPWYARTRGPDNSVTLDPGDITRWKLATQAMETYKHGLVDLTSKNINIPRVVRYKGLGSTLCEKQYGFHHIAWWSAATITTMTVYGLPHLYGWNVLFPTLKESELWRAATVTLLTLAPVVVLPCIASHLTKDNKKSFLGQMATWSRHITHVLWPLAYVFASGYLMVESLRQLADLPLEAFYLPSWSVYFPHFS